MGMLPAPLRPQRPAWGISARHTWSSCRPAHPTPVWPPKFQTAKKETGWTPVGRGARLAAVRWEPVTGSGEEGAPRPCWREAGSQGPIRLLTRGSPSGVCARGPAMMRPVATLNMPLPRARPFHGQVSVPRGQVVSRLRARPGSRAGTCLRPLPVCRPLLRPCLPPGKVAWAPRPCQTASGPALPRKLGRGHRTQRPDESLS